MSILKSPVFIICCVLFLLHQLLQKVFNIAMPLIDQYADVLLAMPIILTLLVLERRLLFRRGNNYRLTILEVVIATLFVAFVSEVLFPAFSDSFTGDWLDVLFFAIGAAVYYFTINPAPEGENALRRK